MQQTPTKRMRSLTAGLLSTCILAAAFGFLIVKKQEFSTNENRYLAAMPKLTWEAVREGTYMEEWSSYLSDHFLFRDFFMGCKTQVEMLLGRREINGVLIAEDGYRIEEYQTPQNTERIIGILQKFADKLPEQSIDLMLVPTAVWVCQDKLPPLFHGEDQMQTAELLYQSVTMQKIDSSTRLLEAEKKGEEALFYRSDHHWTTYGAYQGYLSYCEAKGITPVLLEELQKESVTQAFYGTIYSKISDYRMKGDEIVLFYNPKNQLTVTYEDTGEVTDTLYNLDYLKEKDKYSLFLNNIHPLVTVENATADSDRVLVLIKDSYANSMLPFLVNHYAKIYVFDTRYYRMGPSAFIKEHEEITDVLLLYNMNTLDGDLGLRAIY
ncbi:MAG: DHHW family protein [bacterium]|nr:DHHW family protein [bacterium]